MEEGQRDLLVSVASYALLFLLVFGLSGTVELQAFRAQFRDKKGILIGVLCQFVLLPFCGFCSVKAFYLPPVYGITLLIVCSSPGGSYSNFWCSVVNADLALSVAMTTVSSLIAMAALPLNTLLYVHTTYKSHKDDIQIDWVSMGTALGVVMVAVAGGLFVGDRFRRLRGTIHSMGNAAGLCLILLGLVYSSLSRENSEPLWSRGWQFYVATAIPCLVGLVSSLLLSRLAGLPRPQSLSVWIKRATRTQASPSLSPSRCSAGPKLRWPRACQFSIRCARWPSSFRLLLSSSSSAGPTPPPARRFSWRL